MQPGCLEQVRALVGATDFFSNDEIEVAVELLKEALESGTGSGYEFVFAHEQAPGNKLIGYTCYGLTPCTKGSYDLYWIAVHPAHQGKGVGKMLVEQTCRLVQSRQGRAIYAETSGREQYAPSRKFYLRAGFNEVAKLPDFYAPGDDKLIFVRYFL